MAVKQFSADYDWNVGLEAQCRAGYRTVAYSGSLGGGTLQLLTQVQDGDLIALADAKLTAATVDDNGDVVRQMTFSSSGNVWVRLSGSTAPTAKVSVQ
ncbi:hypothetical protein HF272_13800 [Rhizobium leguminosarum]|uniref:hypothetical protein n=1 Tax=Rhizobium leguminosarum TaxID=384 RepID=UPI001C8FE383|nr:hypothetical protein [Rhizobium leguminosarum]MBY2992504.1 hypothetical protein [Rhizobium leguminosarum]